MSINNFLLKRQSFAPTIGWQILYNEFYSISPEDDINPEGSSLMPSWSLFSSTLLHMLHKENKVIIDLGWGPESDPEGAFYITMVRTDDKRWEHPLVKFSSRSKDEIVNKLNELMLAVSNGEIS
ncbi:hypothetical protein [Candidatus Odyssella thessalonicensis]|uniref:hypothetical protein n=1 Tax=Candidatus Odyssella thessalonicensis TaxID=84647 RepID=UPI000225A8D1|nr:hypothetical protein [Candidatus Odyssella thessalonicensis]